jgi:hypothetical protein
VNSAIDSYEDLTKQAASVWLDSICRAAAVHISAGEELFERCVWEELHMRNQLRLFTMLAHYISNRVKSPSSARLARGDHGGQELG